jgi:signal recognition particle subunit SRP54
MMAGVQGSGKTTACAKLALRLKKDGRRPLLVAADLERPAAIEQLFTLGAEVGVPVVSEGREPVKVAKNALKEADRKGNDVVIVDTAGRLHVDEEMMKQARRIRDAVKPDHVLMACDAMTGQDAVVQARAFLEEVDTTGFVLTKLDGDARGGAALSIRGVTGVPIKFVGTGERVDGLEVFDPHRMAGRILQQGDVVGLVEKAQEAFDSGEAKRLEKKVAKEGKFDLEDFLAVTKQIHKLGPLEGFLKMVPGINHKMLKDANLDPKRIRHVEAIILSMTPQERRRPDILNGSRRVRIAKGSGRTVQEVNRLMTQFKEMQKMMKRLKGFGGGRMPKGLPFGT